MQRVRAIFDEYADRYDAWRRTPEGQVIKDTEVQALRPLPQALPRPYLEVGVGTGRFAEALRVEFGLDPSISALERARRGGVAAGLGVAEAVVWQQRTWPFEVQAKEGKVWLARLL